MKVIHTFFLTFILCLSFLHSVFSNDRFSREVKRAIGDLNKDGLSDLAIVTQDTTDATWPYRLQIFFKQSNGEYKLILSTDKALYPRFPDGQYGYQTGYDFDDIVIAKGILVISVQLLRGHYEHKFRYQNMNFELIGFSMAGSDGKGTISTRDFNLSTGTISEIEERYDSNKVISNKKSKLLIRPLPKLQDFQPMQSQLY